MKQSLQKLEDLLPQLIVQAASSILWSCDQVSLNPDSAVSGLTARLLSTIAEDQSAVAEELSYAVWAVATLKHIGHLPPVDMALTTGHCHVCSFYSSC